MPFCHVEGQMDRREHVDESLMNAWWKPLSFAPEQVVSCGDLQIQSFTACT